jgi:hypothetical protein
MDASVSRLVCHSFIEGSFAMIVASSYSRQMLHEEVRQSAKPALNVGFGVPTGAVNAAAQRAQARRADVRSMMAIKYQADGCAGTFGQPYARLHNKLLRRLVDLTSDAPALLCLPSKPHS